MVISPDALHQALDKDILEAGLEVTPVLFPGASIEQAYACSLKSSLTKKFVTARHPEASDRAARKFMQCNDACRDWKLDVNKLTSKTETLLGEVRRALYEFWYLDGINTVADSYYDLLSYAKTGPGVSIGSRSESFYAKLFSSPLSTSSLSLYDSYRRYIRGFPEWSNAENIRIENFGSASVADGRLSFVAKNDEIDRCICVEPTLNTYFQLGLKHLLELRLRRRFGIDFTDQQFKNRDLARLGSITDGLSTIDLSSASDSISRELCRVLLPPGFFNILEKIRTPFLTYKGSRIELHMMSTMGNGFTFPLQTLIFSSVVIAALRFRGLHPFARDSSENLWGVYGDDIICPRSVTGDVIEMLSLFGFKVNNDKSFTEGPFRESCGSDFFMGQNVRGVFLQHLNDYAARFSAVNMLVRFSARSGLYLRNLVRLLTSSVKKIYFVPRYEDSSAGIHVPGSFYRGPVDRDTQSNTYKCLVAVPLGYRIKESWILTPRGLKPLIYNPSGLLISLLQGSVRSSSLTVRQKTDGVLWRKKRRISPNWDFSLCQGRDRPDYGLDWQQWEIAAHILLSS